MAKLVTKAEERRARAIVQRAMDQARAREVAEKKTLIGQCFKYPNRYSDGEEWWLYAIVTGVEDGLLTSLQFERTSTGTMMITPNVIGGSIPHGSWQRIPRVDFVAAETLFNIAVLRALTDRIGI